MPRTILRRGFRNHPARSMLLRATIGMDSERAKGDGRRVQSHGGQQTSCGFRTVFPIMDMHASNQGLPMRRSMVLDKSCS